MTDLFCLPRIRDYVRLKPNDVIVAATRLIAFWDDFDPVECQRHADALAALTAYDYAKTRADRAFAAAILARLIEREMYP